MSQVTSLAVDPITETLQAAISQASKSNVDTTAQKILASVTPLPPTSNPSGTSDFSTITSPEDHQEKSTKEENPILPNAVSVVSTQQPGAAPAQQVTIASGDLDDFRMWQANKRNRRISDLSKKYGNDVGSRRNTLVLRRVKCREIAPDEDVLAYLIIYEMKEPHTAEGKKVQVTDTEIKAYLTLDYDFTSTPTLQEITGRAKELGDIDSGEMFKSEQA